MPACTNALSRLSQRKRRETAFKVRSLTTDWHKTNKQLSKTLFFTKKQDVTLKMNLRLRTNESGLSGTNKRTHFFPAYRFHLIHP